MGKMFTPHHDAVTFILFTHSLMSKFHDLMYSTLNIIKYFRIQMLILITNQTTQSHPTKEIDAFIMMCLYSSFTQQLSH